MTAFGIIVGSAVLWFVLAPREVGKHAADIVAAYRDRLADIRSERGGRP